MNKSKIILRDSLGLIGVVSAVSICLAVMLDITAVFAYFSHEELIADEFFHESIPLFFFLIPAYFIPRYINRSEWVSEVQAYHKEMAKKWSESN